jgi:glutathione S-transferase
MKIWIDHITSRIIPAFHRFLQHTKDSPYSLDAARAEFLGHLKTWIKEADPTGPYFAGEQFSMADVALAPWAVRLWVFDHFKDGGLGMPEKGKGGEDEEAWERWRVWVKAIQGRKSVQETMSEREHYLPIYTRYAENRAQSELAKATRKGRGVP